MGTILKIAGGKYTETAGTILKHAKEGSIVFNSADDINYSAGRNITFGEYEAPEIKEKEELKIINLEGPFDIESGEKLSKGISRFKDYHYVVHFNKDVGNTYNVYWGQSLDDESEIKSLLNPHGRSLRGGIHVDDDRKKLRVKLRFGEGSEKFKVHAYLNNRYYESTSLEVRYNKVVGVVTEVNGNTHHIDLFEVECTGEISINTVVKNVQTDLGGAPNDAHKLFYDIKTPANIMLDGFGGSGNGMQKAGGSVRLGTSTKPFSPKYYSKSFDNLDGFRGNQYTTTRQLTRIGKTLGKVGTAGTIVIGGADIYNSYQYEGEFGKETQQAAGGLIGGLGGSAGGAYIGGLVGAAFWGVGAIPGAIIGGIVGGYFGAEGGEAAVEYIQKN